ncbi:putative nucleoporin [Dioscorea sansibarensis]
MGIKSNSEESDDHSCHEGSNVKRVSRVPKRLPQKELADSYPRPLKGNKEWKDSNQLQFKASNNGQNRLQKPKMVASTTKSLNSKKEKFMTSPSKPPCLFEGSDEKTAEEVKDVDALGDALSYNQRNRTVDKTTDPRAIDKDDDQVSVYRKIEKMEYRIKKLEEELREVAALEISLYSVVPEHGNSAHKVHAPARRLARVYFHACKHWTLDSRATVASNIVSGLVLITKSCGNDVSRLTFWLSNVIILREVVSQTFSCLSQSSTGSKLVGTSDGTKENRKKLSPLKYKDSNFSKQTGRPDSMQPADDWQEAIALISALEKIEIWLFSRAVESVWSQSFHLLIPVEGLFTTNKYQGSLETALDDQHEGKSYINIWTNAFHDAFTRICPVQAGGHKCGCLPVLTKLIMKECICRLDVAMFNAILQEDSVKVSTDSASDPIGAKFLPIPAGNLSFGFGVQLKSSIGIWSRVLTDLCRIDVEADKQNDDDDDKRRDVKLKRFRLLDELSDLLMLPKDNLLNDATRKEICKSLGPSAVKRVVYNFTPDEFLPDPVPDSVLEELNRECLLKSLKKHRIPFPRPAAEVVYSAPPAADVAEAVAELERIGSLVQCNGYASDEDMYDNLDSSFASIILENSVSLRSGVKTQTQYKGVNSRYRLLHKVW